MHARSIEQVMNERTESLMAIPGVTGVAIGALGDGTPCIQVLVLERTKALEGRIPGKIEGHPVEIVVSGKIRPL